MTETISIDLAAKLSAVTARLVELEKLAGQDDLQVRELRVRVAEAEQAAKTDREMALIDGRRPNLKLSTDLEALVLASHAALAKLFTEQGAVTRQRAILDGIRGQIDERRHADRLAAAKPHWDRWLQLTLEAAEEMRQFNVASRGERLEANELSGSDLPFEVRAQVCGMSGQSMVLLNVLALYDRVLADKLWKAA